jgi:hypothetical protein
MPCSSRLLSTQERSSFESRPGTRLLSLLTVFVVFSVPTEFHDITYNYTTIAPLDNLVTRYSVITIPFHVISNLSTESVVK